jgi:hypothetical protein
MGCFNELKLWVGEEDEILRGRETLTEQNSREEVHVEP